MFPIAWMWYFGTNLDARFSVPDFWPEPGTTHKLPFEREELAVLAERLKADRLERRRRRLGREGRKEAEEEAGDQVAQVEQRTLVGGANGTFEVGSIE